MELSLSLGNKPLVLAADESNHDSGHRNNRGAGFKFCMGSSIRSEDEEDTEIRKSARNIDDFVWTRHQMIKENGATYSFSNPLVIVSMMETDGGTGVAGSPNSETSSFGMSNRRSLSVEDEDEVSGSCRKKLKLSRDQSAFLEERFKEHITLNPKQKLAIAKQLNLRPRQVEVWFQNRRARTKLKQTEVDCELLKKCCETLTKENRRLHKELQGLRALKSSGTLRVQSPATTLTMCPSCESTSTMAATATKTASSNSISQITAFPAVTKRRPFYPFPLTKTRTSPTSSSS